MGVLSIWRYPVKAMLGELLRSVRVGPGGLEGDRRWVVADAATGELVAGKRGPTDARLRESRAEIDEDGQLVVTLPDGRSTARGAALAGDLLSDLLGREVALLEHPRGGGGFMRTDGHHDFAPVHVLTTGALELMRGAEPAGDWDVRRYRPNVVLDHGVPASDGELLGAELRAGSGLALRVGLPTPRCVVPTRARQELPADPTMLKRIAAVSRWDLGPFGRPPCLGTYAEVTAPGELDAGERLSVSREVGVTPEEVVARTIERLTRIDSP